jgi:hypothetical protein
MYDRESNLAALGKPSDQGAYYATVANMSRFMQSQNLISNPVDPTGVIDASFLTGSAQ